MFPLQINPEHQPDPRHSVLWQPHSKDEATLYFQSLASKAHPDPALPGRRITWAERARHHRQMRERFEMEQRKEQEIVRVTKTVKCIYNR